MLGKWIAAVSAVALSALGIAWWSRILAQNPHGSVFGFNSVAHLANMQNPAWLPWVAAGAAVLAIALLVRRRELARGRTVAVLAGGILLVTMLVGASPFGHYSAITAIALFLACAVGLQLPANVGERDDPRRDWIVAGALWLLVAAIASVFTLHRYHAFGAGSWDLGCMIHNFYRASRFLDSTSTVLGEVDYLGDHFMIGIYLYAPLFWVHASGTTLLLIQSINLAAVAPAIFLIARHKGADLAASAALAIVAALSFGLQSAHYFDSHEICVGFGFLAFGVWALETGRLRLATLLFALFVLFKESLGAYWIALGLLAVWRGIRDADRRPLKFGAVWIAAGAVWFVLVNRVFMPALIARGNPPEPHETFGDFGPTVFAAMIGVLSDPLRAIGALAIPGDKVSSQLVTLSNLGWLPIAGPEVLLAAAPLLAERFLSSKHTMWEMGYHYAAPLAFYAAWAAAIGWPRIGAVARRLLQALGGDPARDRAGRVLGCYLLAMGIIVNAVGYRHPANFYRWEMEYFSKPERRAANHEAVDLLDDLDRDAKLAAQNRILPHLAARPFIYRLGDWSKADFVLLSVGENAWPWDDGFPRRLAQQLAADPGWKLIFSKGDAAIFARTTATDRPPVPPSPSLGIPIDVGPGGR